MNRWPDRLQVAVRWVPRLFLLQLGWLCQCAAGGVLLGIAPATNVLAAQLLKFLAHPDAPFEWARSWSLWRGEFWSSQSRLGVPLAHGVLVGLCLWVARGTVFAAPAAVFAFAFAVWLLHLPVTARVNDDGSVLADWHGALQVIIRRPIIAGLMTVATAAAFTVGAIYSPVALLAFGASAPLLASSFAVMRYARATTRAT